MAHTLGLDRLGGQGLFYLRQALRRAVHEDVQQVAIGLYFHYAGQRLNCRLDPADQPHAPLSGDEVAPRDQLVALDGGIVVDRLAVIPKIFRVILDTTQKTALPRWHRTLC